MKLEQQVCSLELARRLAELGVKQESLFYWQQYYVEGRKGESMSAFKLTQQNTESVKGMRCFSAFTVAELGEMLPVHIRTYKSVNGGWFCQQETSTVFRNADTEADARAKMLIYLIEIENKLVTR